MRVLEIGDNLAAAFCGRLFAATGAEVTRIRPPSKRARDIRQRSLDVYLNSKKTIVEADLFDAEDRSLVSTLAAEADVLVADLVPASLEGIDWDALAARIKVSITPFGLTGPWRDWQATGPVLMAIGGHTALTGDADREPLSLPINYVEYQSGQYAYAAAASLAYADDGAPHTVEISMLEVALSLSQFTTVMWTCGGQIRERHGNAWANLHPIAMYPCRDGWFLVTVVPTFWANFACMLGHPELIEDARFATNEARIANRDQLDRIIVDALAGYTMAELMEMGQRQFRVPIGAAERLGDVLASEHLEARHYFERALVEGKEVRMPGPAFQYVDTENADGPA